MPSIKGTASVSDARAMSKALKSTKFPSSFSNRVNLSRVNRQVMMDWIDSRVSKILGFEDEIVASTAGNLFMPTAEEGMMAPEVDPRRAQIDLAGFLGDEQAAEFAKDLWGLLLDAQNAPQGIPRQLMEEKKRELEKIKAQRSQDRRPYMNEGNRRGDMRGPGMGRGRGGGDRWGRYEPPPHYRDRDRDRNFRRDDYPRGPPPNRRFNDYRDRGPPPPHYRDDRDRGRGPPPHHYDHDRGPPHPRGDYPRHPRSVSPPHGDDRGGPFRDGGRGPPPPQQSMMEDEFGRARMPPRERERGRSPIRNNDRDADRRPPFRDNDHNNNYNRRENDRDRHGPPDKHANGTTGERQPVKLIKEESDNKRNSNAKEDGPNSRPIHSSRSRSPSARSSSSEDSYNRRRRRRRKESRRRNREDRHRSSRKRGRRDDYSSDEDDKRHRKRRDRHSSSRSRSRSSSRSRERDAGRRERSGRSGSSSRSRSPPYGRPVR